MKIGILQTGHVPESLFEAHGDYPGMFARFLSGHGFEFITWNVEAGDVPDDPHAAEGWLITGSRHGVYEDHAFIPPLEALIRAVAAAGVPMVGICFGHQIIAKALGGRVEKYAGGWAVGAQSYTIEGQEMQLNAWHQDQVVEPPQSARSVGSSAFCAHAALAYGSQIFTVQPHPEFDAGFIEGLIETRARGVVPDALIAAARARLGAPVNAAPVAARMANVLLGKGAA